MYYVFDDLMWSHNMWSRKVLIIFQVLPTTYGCSDNFGWWFDIPCAWAKSIREFDIVWYCLECLVPLNRVVLIVFQVHLDAYGCFEFASAFG